MDTYDFGIFYLLSKVEETEAGFSSFCPGWSSYSKIQMYLPVPERLNPKDFYWLEAQC